MKLSTIPALMLAGAVLWGAAGRDAAASEEVTELTASRAAVAAACRVSRGIAIGTDARSGAYGCISRGGWISCDESGSCLGARNDEEPEAREPETAPARLPASDT